MASRIEITFNGEVALNDTLTFYQSFNGVAQQTIIETWKSVRSNNYEVSSILHPTGIPGERSAMMYREAINLDYYFNLPSDLGSVTRVSNKIIIEYFNNVQYDVTGINNPPEVDIEIFNGEVSFFDFDNIQFLEADSNQCTNYKVSVETTELATEYTYNGITITGNNSNPFTFDAMRGQNLYISAKSADDQTISQSFTLSQVPRIINAGILTINVSTSPNGATATGVINIATGTNEFEFSLDNSTWQSSNVFTGLIAGTYTMYVRDQYGCSFNKGFTFSETESDIEPYFFISKSNSLRFAQRVTWGNCSNYKTRDNTLSCEANVKHPYKEIQEFQSCDTITTQIKSNYGVNSATVVQEDGTETPLTVTQKSEFRGLKDVRDARKYNLGNNQTGIYFVSGDLYDFDTGTPTGETYTLNGALPYWAKIGNFVKLESAWLEILNILYDETVQADVLVVSSIYTGADALTQVSAVYDLFSYEVYEFALDMGNYLNENIQVRINATDTYFTDLEFLSEVINIKARQDETAEIVYYNDDNTDMFYATGITNKLRLPLNRQDAKPNFEVENYNTDTSTILLGSDKRRGKEFTFEPVTEGIMEKLTEALMHRFLFIDGVRYVSATAPEIEGALEDTNLYDVKAILIEAGSVFNSNSGDGNNQATGTTGGDVPGLIDSDNGYVIY